MLEQWDDHYNQTPYRYERDGIGIFTAKPGQRINYPFLFNRQSAPVFIMAWEEGHKTKWFIGECHVLVV